MGYNNRNGPNIFCGGIGRWFVVNGMTLITISFFATALVVTPRFDALGEQGAASCPTTNASGIPDETVRRVNAWIEQRVAEKSMHADDRDAMVARPANELIAYLSSYIEADDGKSRRKWYAIGEILLSLYKKQHENVDTRKQCVKLLIQMSAKYGEWGMLKTGLEDDLCPISIEDFSKDDMAALAREVNGKKGSHPELWWVAGYLNLTDTSDKLKEIAAPWLDGSEKDVHADCWAAMAALARMGNSKAVEKLVDGVRNIEDNREKADMAKWWLPYVRQPEAVRLLVELILSKKTYLVSGMADGTTDTLPIGLYLPRGLEILTKTIPPQEKNDDLLERLVKLRVWLLEQSKLVIKETGAEVDISDIVKKVKEQN